jgi:hypothetical protein
MYIYGRWRKTLDMLITRYSITGNGEEFSCVLFLLRAPEDLISYFREHFHIRREIEERRGEFNYKCTNEESRAGVVFPIGTGAENG